MLLNIQSKGARCAFVLSCLVLTWLNLTCRVFHFLVHNSISLLYGLHVWMRAYTHARTHARTHTPCSSRAKVYLSMQLSFFSHFLIGIREFPFLIRNVVDPFLATLINIDCSCANACSHFCMVQVIAHRHINFFAADFNCTFCQLRIRHFFGFQRCYGTIALQHPSICTCIWGAAVVFDFFLFSVFGTPQSKIIQIMTIIHSTHFCVWCAWECHCIKRCCMKVVYKIFLLKKSRLIFAARKCRFFR